MRQGLPKRGIGCVSSGGDCTVGFWLFRARVEETARLKIRRELAVSRGKVRILESETSCGWTESITEDEWLRSWTGECACASVAGEAQLGVVEYASDGDEKVTQVLE